MMLYSVLKRIRGFARAEEGVAALEFGMLALPFLTLILATMELAMLMTANSTVESALAVASRQVRTGQVQSGEISRDDLIADVCSFIDVIGTCEGNLFVEVRNFSNFSSFAGGAPACSDSGGDPPFEPGDSGDVVMVRLCYVYDVIMPGIGLSLADVGDGKRASIVTSVFRNEPFGEILDRESQTMRTILRTRLPAFGADDRGSALIEFGMIAPVMFVMLMGVVWAADLMQANRHVTFAAGTLADLTAQEKQLFDEDVAEIFLAVEETLKPYEYTNVVMTVSSVKVDEDGEATIHWSESNAGAAHATDDPYDLPTGLNKPNTALIVAEMWYDHETPVKLGGLVHKAGIDSIRMYDEFFMRPRRSNVVKRCYSVSDCV